MNYNIYLTCFSATLIWNEALVRGENEASLDNEEKLRTFSKRVISYNPACGVNNNFEAERAENLHNVNQASEQRALKLSEAHRTAYRTAVALGDAVTSSNLVVTGFYVHELLSNSTLLSKLKPDIPRKKVRKDLKRFLEVVTTSEDELTPRDVYAIDQAITNILPYSQADEATTTLENFQRYLKTKKSEPFEDWNEDGQVLHGLRLAVSMLSLLLKIRSEGQAFDRVVLVIEDFYKFELHSLAVVLSGLA